MPQRRKILYLLRGALGKEHDVTRPHPLSFPLLDLRALSLALSSFLFPFTVECLCSLSAVQYALLKLHPGRCAAHSVLRRRGRRARSPSPVQSLCLPIRIRKIQFVSPSSAPASLAHPPLSVSASSPSHLPPSLSPFTRVMSVSAVAPNASPHQRTVVQ